MKYSHPLNSDVVLDAAVVDARESGGFQVVDGEGIGHAGAEGVLDAAKSCATQRDPNSHFVKFLVSLTTFSLVHADGVALVGQVHGAVAVRGEVKGHDPAREAGVKLQAAARRT